MTNPVARPATSPTTFARSAPASSTRAPDAEFLLALESAGRQIRDPVAKLKYIRGSLARHAGVRRAISLLPWAPARLCLYRWLSLESMRHLLAPNAMGAPSRVVPGLRRRLLLARFASAAVALSALAAAAAGIAYRPAPPPAAAAVLAAGPAPARAAAAEALPALPAGVTPARVWLVEKGEGFEQYSNGLRVDTSFAVAGEPRRYWTFDRASGRLGGVREQPVGILFHTSESDIWPLEEANNEQLRDSSQRLLRYVQRGRLYHYLIDRFGRVFRVVAEGSKANHAGNSIWARGDEVHLNLNHAFFGICFETRWEGGRALPVTAAQLAAGRGLTDYLRQRYQFAPEMCTAHGLTSVNRAKHLIGHHVDWARGFPFEAFGLPDQYQRPAPSVVLFGFGYDGDFLKVMGEPWPGVRAAEQMLEAEARERGRSVEEIRRERQGLYDKWLQEQQDLARSAEAEPKARVERAPERGVGG